MCRGPLNNISSQPRHNSPEVEALGVGARKCAKRPRLHVSAKGVVVQRLTAAGPDEHQEPAAAANHS